MRPFLCLLASLTSLHAFTIHPRSPKRPSLTLYRRSPSRVVDHDGPTPDWSSSAIPEIDPDEIEELRELTSVDELPTPIPHQPWRRGETAGCEAPLDADWRLEAEELIRQAALTVGAQVLDVTWYLTAVVVTLQEDLQLERDFMKRSGPPIDIITKSDALYEDPADPNPEEIWYDPEEIVYERESQEEAAAAEQRRNMMFATKDQDDPVDETHIPDKIDGDEVGLYMNQETRSDVVLKEAEDRLERYEEAEKPIDLDSALRIDTAALSTIGQAILDALETREEELDILSRHELILTSPGPSDVLESQKQFNAFRGSPVIVETQDPFESNRTLKGKLVDRNAMDVILNIQGRMVTVPLNFVKCVRLPKRRTQATP